MRRTREERDDTDSSTTTSTALQTIQHPSKFFVPYTGRYYLHFIARNLKGAAGHNMRLLLHSNGLSVLCLDPSHLLVVSYFNLLKSLPEYQNMSSRAIVDREAEAKNKTRMIERIEFCSSFSPSSSDNNNNVGDEKSSSSCCPGAKSDDEKFPCSNPADIYSLVLQQKVALCSTSISHQVNGTRGQRDRLTATKSLKGKGKRHATYAQEEMTICSFPCETLVKCPSCGKWQLVQQTLQNHQKQQDEETTNKGTTEDSKNTQNNKNEKDQQQQNKHKQWIPSNPPENCALKLPFIPVRDGDDDDKQDKNKTLPNAKAAKPFFLPRSIKVPITVNSVLVEVNSAISDAVAGDTWENQKEARGLTNTFELAFSDPIGKGFLGVVQPKADVSFTNKFERAGLETPMVSPCEKVRVFVADSFTGTNETQ